MTGTYRELRIPRWVHREYARLFGYFWIPCPLCREPFGGHEWRRTPFLSNVITVRGGSDPEILGRLICRTCTLARRGGKEYDREDVYIPLG